MYLKHSRARSLPEAAAAALTKEIKRLSDLPLLSAEVAVAKTYLDNALGLPWGARSASPSRMWRPWRGCSTRPTTASRRQGPHRGVPGRGHPAGRHASQHHPLPGGAARSGQDLGGHGHSPGAGPAAAAHQPGRRARRGRDPGPRQDLRGLHARSHHRRAQAGRCGRPGDRPGRDRQDVLRLAGRPGRGSHGGARPGAEPDFPRHLPGTRL